MEISPSLTLDFILIVIFLGQKVNQDHRVKHFKIIIVPMQLHQHSSGCQILTQSDPPTQIILHLQDFRTRLLNIGMLTLLQLDRSLNLAAEFSTETEYSDKF